MSAGKILLLVLVLMLIGVLPVWPHSVNFGYDPAGGLVVIILILLLFKII